MTRTFPLTTSVKKLRTAASLVELIVVVAVIALLLALLLPAVQGAREAARRTYCLNNLRQLGLAVHQYSAAYGRIPPAFCVSRWQTAAETGESWSAQARLLPFLEQDNASKLIALDVDWHDQVTTGVTYQQMPWLLCPAEPNRHIRYKNQAPYVAPVSYGFYGGSWHIFAPETLRGGDGVFIVNGHLRLTDVRDGLSNTLAAAEVKTYQPYLRNTQRSLPNIPDQIDTFRDHLGEFKTTGHTVWPDGRIHHSGVTTTFSPNQVVPFVHQNRFYDIDYSTQQEGNSARHDTYAAVTARSYHTGRVNSLRMDGSVHIISNSIDLSLYRALGSRAGGEIPQRSR